MASIRRITWPSPRDGKPVSNWQASYKDSHGKRRAKSFKKKTDAKAFLDRVNRELQTGTHTPERETVTFAEAAELYLNAKANTVEASTLTTYRHEVGYAVGEFGHYKLTQLTQPMIECRTSEWLAKWSYGIAASCLRGTNKVLTYAQKVGLVAQNVARDVRMPSNSRQKTKLMAGEHFPSKEEAAKILNTANGRWRPVVTLALLAGLRASEIRGLRWSDVDFETGYLNVRQRADDRLQIGPCKSQAGQRSIPMSPYLRNVLTEWRSWCPKGDLDLVCPSPRGAVQSLATMYRDGIGPLMVKCGLVDDHGAHRYTLHKLRHWYASFLIDQRFTEKQLTTYMGHTAVGFTLDRYGHLFKSDDAHDRMATAEAGLFDGQPALREVS